ncbi:MAG: hypothetical protein ACKVZ0_19830 [Gemmatimonadales bacterium]
MIRRCLPALVLALAGTAPAAAQSPERPRLPVKTLSVDLVSAKAYDLGSVTYVRAGLKPTEFRFGTSPSLTGATWNAFTEGQTTTTTSGTGTRIQGTIPYGVPPIPPQSGCGPGELRLRAYLQFRTRVIQTGQLLTSPIRGDSSCVYVGG